MEVTLFLCVDYESFVLLFDNAYIVVMSNMKPTYSWKEVYCSERSLMIDLKGGSA
jgi:hypothetical protein